MIKKTEFHSSIFLLDQFCSLEFCNSVIARANDIGFERAPVQSVTGEVFRPDVRSNDRAIIDDEEMARELWKESAQYFPDSEEGSFAVGFNERFRIYRYGPGQSFNWHYDGAYERSSGERSHYTFMIYLNEGFEGGETSFNDFDVYPKLGQVLAFPHELRHRGSKVTSGLKYVLRTDVMYSCPDAPLFL